MRTCTGVGSNWGRGSKMDGAMDAEVSGEELQRALYSVDEEIICEYFQRGNLLTLDVSPVLLAAATLQTMLKSNPVAHYQCYAQALQLLEYIHSQSPPLGNEVEYVDLVVELKTRAVLYELFEEVVITEQLKREVLGKFLGVPPPNQTVVITEDTLTSVEEYSEYLHNRARRGLERVLASEELWLTFRHTHFFNHEKSKTTDAALLRDLTRYLTSIRNSIQYLPPAQEASNEYRELEDDTVSETEASEDIHHQSPAPTISPHKQQHSSDAKSSGTLRHRSSRIQQSSDTEDSGGRIHLKRQATRTLQSSDTEPSGQQRSNRTRESSDNEPSHDLRHYGSRTEESSDSKPSGDLRHRSSRLRQSSGHESSDNQRAHSSRKHWSSNTEASGGLRHRSSRLQQSSGHESSDNQRAHSSRKHWSSNTEASGGLRHRSSRLQQGSGNESSDNQRTYSSRKHWSSNTEASGGLRHHSKKFRQSSGNESSDNQRAYSSRKHWSSNTEASGGLRHHSKKFRQSSGNESSDNQRARSSRKHWSEASGGLRHHSKKLRQSSGNESSDNQRAHRSNNTEASGGLRHHSSRKHWSSDTKSSGDMIRHSSRLQQSSDTEPSGDLRCHSSRTQEMSDTEPSRTQQRQTVGESPQSKGLEETGHSTTEEPMGANTEAHSGYNLRRQGRDVGEKNKQQKPRNKKRTNKRRWSKVRKRKVVVAESATRENSATDRRITRSVAAERQITRTSGDSNTLDVEGGTVRNSGDSGLEEKTITRSSGDNNSFGVEGRTLMFNLSLTPVKLVHSPSSIEHHTPAFPGYATPPRTSVRLAMKRHADKSVGGSGGDRLPVAAADTDTAPADVARVATRETPYGARLRQRRHPKEEDAKEDREPGMVSTTTRYHLRHRGPRKVIPPSASEDTATSMSEPEEAEEEEVPMKENRTAGRRRQRTASSKQSAGRSGDPPDQALRQGVAETQSPQQSRQRQQQPRAKRQRVAFYESPRSSQEERMSSGGGSRKSGRREMNKTAVKVSTTPRQGDKVNRSRGGGRESGNFNGDSPRKNKRKQVTPRRLVQTVNDRLVSFLPDDHNTTSGAHKQKHTTDTVNNKRASSPKMAGGSTRHHSDAQVFARAKDSSSECEATKEGVIRTQRHGTQTRHHHHKPPQPSSFGQYKVVDLADENTIEQSQPNTQWDYVAVQTVAESAVNADRARSTTLTHAGHKRKRQRSSSGWTASDIDMSDHEQVSVKTWSSEEVALAPHSHQQLVRNYAGGGDRPAVVFESSSPAVVFESSSGSSSPILIPPALLSLDVLKRRM